MAMVALRCGVDHVCLEEQCEYFPFQLLSYHCSALLPPLTSHPMASHVISSPHQHVCMHSSPLPLINPFTHSITLSISLNEQFWSSVSSSLSDEGKVHGSSLIAKETKTAKELMLQKPREKPHEKQKTNEEYPGDLNQGNTNPLESVDISRLSTLYVENMKANDVHVIFSTDCNAFQVKLIALPHPRCVVYHMYAVLTFISCTLPKAHLSSTTYMMRYIYILRTGNHY